MHVGKVRKAYSTDNLPHTAFIASTNNKFINKFRMMCSTEIQVRSYPELPLKNPKVFMLPPRFFAYFAAAGVFLLCLLCLLWEGPIAPARPGGSWLILKGLPIFCAFPGLLKGKRYTAQWASLLILMYLMEGAVRAFDPGISGLFAMLEVGLAGTTFCAMVYYAHITAPSKQINKQY